MRYIILFLFAVFISSCSQIILKQSADKSKTNIIKDYLNMSVIIAYILFFSATLFTTFAYRYIPLSLGSILESSSYIFVSVMGYFILKENIKRRKLLGIIIIFVGIIVFNI